MLMQGEGEDQETSTQVLRKTFGGPDVDGIGQPSREGDSPLLHELEAQDSP